MPFISNIFSVKNIYKDNCVIKQITILGMKISFENKNKTKYLKKKKEYIKRIQDLTKRIKNHRSFINLYIDIKEIPPDNGIMRKYQIADVFALRIIDLICKKYNIKYWLDLGTCLGAYRHNGFIPWDDDIDIGLLRKDYNRLISVLKEEIAQFGFEINEGYGYEYSAITRIIYKNSGIQIDLYPFDQYYKESLSDNETDELRKKFILARDKFYSLYPETFLVDNYKFPRDEFDSLIKMNF